MRLPATATSQSRLRFNITPLIDVVFLLIIFFLVASHFVRNEVAEPVDLPLAESAQQDQQSISDKLTITINREGRMSVSGEPITDETAQFRIGQLTSASDADVEVRIRADRGARYAAIRKVLRWCADQKIESVQFAVIDPVTNP